MLRINNFLYAPKLVLNGHCKQLQTSGAQLNMLAIIEKRTATTPIKRLATNRKE